LCSCYHTNNPDDGHIRCRNMLLPAVQYKVHQYIYSPAVGRSLVHFMHLIGKSERKAPFADGRHKWGDGITYSWCWEWPTVLRTADVGSDRQYYVQLMLGVTDSITYSWCWEWPTVLRTADVGSVSEYSVLGIVGDC
jgi:hypothetical protein